MTCAESGCTRAAKCRGLCNLHYKRAFRRGTVPPPLARTRVDELWARATPEPNTGCLLWTGNVDEDGYGRFWFRGEKMLAHRAAWEIVNGPIPAGLCVLHRCDTPGCIQSDPDPANSHLFLGTNLDNVRDMISKNRHASVLSPESRPRGVDAPTAKLTEGDVQEIRRLKSENGAGCRRLARRYGVDKSTIHAILHRKSWRHVA